MRRSICVYCFMLVVICVLAFSCEQMGDIVSDTGPVESTPIKVEPAEPVKEKKIKTIIPNEKWADFLYTEISNSGLVDAVVADSSDFCKSEFTVETWTHLMAAVMKRESNFKPSTEYKENFKNSKGEWVISTGLFQLSLESAKGYGCDIGSQSDLKDPYKNIKCAVKILERWVLRDARIASKVNGKWMGGARYWSVLRSSVDKTKALMPEKCK